MASFTVRDSSCPAVHKHARRRARQEAIESSRSESLSEAIVGEGRSALDAYVREGARKMLQAKAKSDLHQIWLAETREAATKAFDHFLEKYGVKYEAACACLSKDRDSLLGFYDFPAEHWGHLRTTNPIESTFATIRLRHRRTKGSGSRRASLTMMFKLAQSASKRWRRLNAHHQIVLVLEGRIFTDGVLQNAA